MMIAGAIIAIGAAGVIIEGTAYYAEATLATAGVIGAYYVGRLLRGAAITIILTTGYKRS